MTMSGSATCSPIRIAYLGVLLLALTSFLPPTVARAEGAEGPSIGLRIYFIDVLGGAATLVVTPERETVLIDSGWPGEGDRDPERIARAVRDAGCDRIDHLVTTHWHIDHFGGVAGLAKRLPIGTFWDRGLPEDGITGEVYPDGPKPDDPLGIAYRKASEGRRKILKAGDSLPLRGETSAIVLAASGKVIPAPKGAVPNPACSTAPDALPKDASDNALSIVLRFRLGAFDFLDCGDLTWNIERDLVCPVDLVGRIDLYQVTHHGMDISNHPTLLRTIAPSVAIMNNGPRKGGSAATVRRLRDIPSLQAAYQLHRNAATGEADNTTADLIANPEPAGGRYIRVTVAPDGSGYKVQLGADGPERSFASH
jgi:beta-lactamase superfamily II metal-dependent hydrolase